MDRLQNNPSIRWVHPKSTHAHPLTWGNKNGGPISQMGALFQAREINHLSSPKENE
jgi:hypothetical protein